MITSITPQPALADLERYRCQESSVTYWKTIDFFPYDEQNAVWFSNFLAGDQETIERRIQARASEIGIAAEALKQQFENYVKVKQTPFCIWQIDPVLGEQKPTFFTSLDTLVAENSPAAKPIGALGKFFSISKRIAPWIWAIVLVVVIIPMIGQWFMVQSLPKKPIQPAIVQTNATPNPTIQAPQPVANWDQFERLTKDKMRNAHVKTEAFARKELDDWANGLTQRLDESFLDWYFGYFHQKQLQYESFFTGISGKFQQWLDPSKPSPQEKIAEEITREFQEEFAKRVLVPQISEFQLQNITLKTAKAYLRELGQEFNQIPIESDMSAAEWDRYLRETSIAIPGMEGKSVALPLKQMTAVGAYAALKPLIVPLLPKVGSAVVGKMATKIGAKLATKTGGTLAAKLGGTLLDATVGVGILLWDVWDTNHTANIEKPILRKNLIDYITQVEESVLENPTNGIMTVTSKIDEEILRSIHIVKDAQASFAGAKP
ncbi:hypothetical protein H6F86_03860 [Phormidium sp. FACHB-592]|uniref:Uncharacterized protein n=1 Tax=Stenomitos frigidus AS-A4 TaxID=2933935 RepID=A0ABV0KQV4_9CYAN|nr:hypothetical protein [Phormidium sp. FACHB-592]MBD2073035.1 hypothetical protein [Phormidium sp. FACHB-592]